MEITKFSIIFLADFLLSNAFEYDFNKSKSFMINTQEISIKNTDDTGVKMVIIDTDGGIDDAMAVMIAMASHDIDLIAITTTSGVTTAKVAATNIKKTLNIVKAYIPVFTGSVNPIISNSYANNQTEKAFDEISFVEEETDSIEKKEHAISFMIRIVQKHPYQVTIVALGPLTNVAMAIKFNPEFKSKVKNIYWTGGSMHGFGKGNLGVEFNSYFDPIATYICFTEIGMPIIMLPLEASEKCAISTLWRKRKLGSINSEQMMFFNKIESDILKNKTWSTRDTKTMLAVITKRVIKKMNEYFVDVIWEGEKRGRTIVDYVKLSKNKPNALVIKELDEKVVKELLLHYLQIQIYIDVATVFA